MHRFIILDKAIYLKQVFVNLFASLNKILLFCSR